MQLGMNPATGNPYPGYLIQTDDGSNILVDTGFGPKMVETSRRPDHQGARVTEDDLVVNQLARLGVRPENIRYREHFSLGSALAVPSARIRKRRHPHDRRAAVHPRGRVQMIHGHDHIAMLRGLLGEEPARTSVPCHVAPPLAAVRPVGLIFAARLRARHEHAHSGNVRCVTPVPTGGAVSRRVERRSAEACAGKMHTVLARCVRHARSEGALALRPACRDTPGPPRERGA